MDDQTKNLVLQLHKVSFFDQNEQETNKTRTSTFSKASDGGREEIKKNQTSYYEAFM